MTVQIFGALIASVFAAGTAADNLISYPHKKIWHDKAVRFWIRLDETPIPDLPQLLAKRAVSWIEKLLNTKWKGLLIYTSVTVVFLTIALDLSTKGYSPIGSSYTLNLTPQEKALKQDIFDASPLPHVAILMTVGVFDLSVLWLSLWVLRAIQNAGRLATLSVILGHIALLLLISTICLGTITFVSNSLLNQGALGMRYQRRIDNLLEIDKWNFLAKQTNSFNSGQILSTNAVVVSSVIQNSLLSDWAQASKNVYHLTRGKKATEIPLIVTIFNNNGTLFQWTHGPEMNVPKTNLLMAGTLAYPTLLLMAILAFLLIAKVVLALARAFSLYFIDLATEKSPDQFKPFFLIACSIDLLLLLTVAFKQLLLTL